MLGVGVWIVSGRGDELVALFERKGQGQLGGVPVLYGGEDGAEMVADDLPARCKSKVEFNGLYVRFFVHQVNEIFAAGVFSVVGCKR